MSKKQLVFDAFDNKVTERVPVGFWFHFAPDNPFDNRPEIIQRNIDGHQKYYDEFHPDFMKLMSDGYFHYPNPTLEKIETAADLKKAQSGLVDEWIDAQAALVKELTSRFGDDVATFYNIFAPATYLSFVLQNPGDKLTLAKLVVKLITESKAVSIGLTNRQAYLKIIIPQALTAALPR